MNILFICNQNQNRSKLAEELFKNSFHTDSAGLWNDHPVTKEQLQWSDIIISMEEQQRTELARRFPKECFEKRLLNANIPDVYKYNDPRLRKELLNTIPLLIQPLLELI